MRCSTPSATAVTRSVSVKTGKWRLCCSHAAIGARTSTPLRSTRRICGAVISWKRIEIPHLTLFRTAPVGILRDRVLRVNEKPEHRKMMKKAKMLVGLLSGVPLTLAGCGDQDADKLSRVGR